MEKEGFANLLFRIEELLIDIDYWRRQISDCTQYRGWAEEDYGNLYPSCTKALSNVFESLKKVSENAEMRSESPQVFRRPICLSQTATVDSCSAL